jgi:hypothetical protein
MLVAFGEFERIGKEVVADITTKFATRKLRRPQSGYAQFESATLLPRRWR